MVAMAFFYTAEDAEPSEEERRFTVYAHYLEAAAELVRTSVTSHQMVQTIAATPQFQKLQLNKGVDAEQLSKFLRNAWFTEIQARLPRSMPDTVPYANHWLSVQVYYALYLALRGYLLLLQTRTSRNHTKRHCATSLLRR